MTAEELLSAYRSGARCFSGADLSYATLRDADLSCADLRDADLSYADLRYAKITNTDLSRVDLKYADLSYADLSYADLKYADLRYASLRDADLSCADLIGADLRCTLFKNTKWHDGVVINKEPTQVLGLCYPVLILDHHIQIGCELHTFDAWEEFDDARIAAMDGLKSARFWRDLKVPLLAMARAVQK